MTGLRRFERVCSYTGIDFWFKRHNSSDRPKANQVIKILRVQLSGLFIRQYLRPEQHYTFDPLFAFLVVFSTTHGLQMNATQVRRASRLVLEPLAIAPNTESSIEVVP